MAEKLSLQDRMHDALLDNGGDDIMMAHSGRVNRMAKACADIATQETASLKAALKEAVTTMKELVNLCGGHLSWAEFDGDGPCKDAYNIIEKSHTHLKD